MKLHIPIELANQIIGYLGTRPYQEVYQLYLKWLDGYEEIGGEWVKTSDANTPLPAD